MKAKMLIWSLLGLLLLLCAFLVNASEEKLQAALIVMGILLLHLAAHEAQKHAHSLHVERLERYAAHLQDHHFADLDDYHELREFADEMVQANPGYLERYNEMKERHDG